MMTRSLRDNRVPLRRHGPAAMALFIGFFLLVVVGQNPLSAAEEVFSWRQCSGQVLRVMLDKHPYAEGIRERLRRFETLTGIKVVYTMVPDDRYFQSLEEAFASESYKPDVFMTGVQNVWHFAPAGRMVNLDTYVFNPAKTRVGYDFSDFYPNISGAFRWNGKAGSTLGVGPLWAVPVGFEASTLTYNREVLTQRRLRPPRSMTEMLERGRLLNHFDGVDTYGVAARGSGQWNSLNSGYITAFVNYGACDMAVENGRLVSQVNSPEAVAITDLWIRMLKECGSPDWEYMDWYRCLDDLGNRKAAMLLDSDVLGYFANAAGSSTQSGKLGMVPPPIPDGADPARVKTNLWIWGLGINAESENPDAAWLFVQYFTSRDFQLWSVRDWHSVNPPRRSVFEDPVFQRNLSSMDGYIETFLAVIAGGAVCSTPNPYFIDISERWAAVIRDIANGMYGSTQEGMDTLKIWMDNKLADVPVD